MDLGDRIEGTLTSEAWSVPGEFLLFHHDLGKGQLSPHLGDEVAQHKMGRKSCFKPCSSPTPAY